MKGTTELMSDKVSFYLIAVTAVLSAIVFGDSLDWVATVVR